MYGIFFRAMKCWIEFFSISLFETWKILKYINITHLTVTWLFILPAFRSISDAMMLGKTQIAWLTVFAQCSYCVGEYRLFRDARLFINFFSLHHFWKPSIAFILQHRIDNPYRLLIDGGVTCKRKEWSKSLNVLRTC